MASEGKASLPERVGSEVAGLPACFPRATLAAPQSVDCHAEGERAKGGARG